MIKKLRLRYSVPLLCRMLNISESRYYVWLNRKLSRREKEDMRLELEIQAAHKRTRQTCGNERLQKDLAANGIEVGIYRVRKIRKKLGLMCKQVKKFKVTTDSRHNLPVADNILDQKFEATAPNRIWISDITYISTEEGWLYLAGHKDLFTGEVVGYAMDSRMTKELVSRSLFMAVSSKRPEKGLIHHSDRGSQYCAFSYQELLDQFGMSEVVQS